MTHTNIAAEVAAIAAALDPKNLGDLYEWALCRHFGVNRQKHDSGRYDKGSDLELDNGMRISIKYGAFSLMNGTLCEGQTTIDGIWNVYETHTHSNVAAVITDTCDVFLMSIPEFKKFIFTFGHIGRDSKKNGGCTKIQCYKDTKKRLAWLMAQCAA